jgi:LCP family protein required for cell wall assembly
LSDDEPAQLPPFPESAGDAPAAADPHIYTRAELRTERRRTTKKERKRLHRWRRRILWSLGFVVFLAAAGVGGLYVYVNYRYDQIKKIHSKHLVAQAPPGQPFTMLLVGSDTRAFVSNPTQANAFGSDSTGQGGSRSDVTMLARFVPATKTVTVLSIPRDLWVDIPGNVPDISGMNRINAAYNNGPDLLIQTIEQDLDVPVNHYASVDFPGFQDMVTALGGVTMDFPTEVKDQLSGLDITTPGCQVVDGATALELVRARHLYYMQDGEWVYDGQSDFSRIQRQDAFFRALLDKIGTLGLNPLTINSFIGAAVGNLTIDDTLSKSDLFNIASEFRGLPSSHFITETLPTTEYITSGGAEVLKAAEPYAFEMLNNFKNLGVAAPKTPPTSTTTTTQPTEAHNLVDVDVLNASEVNGIAHATASALGAQGFTVTGIGNAAAPIQSGGSSQILYGPSGSQAARTLASALSGPVTEVPDSSLSGQQVTLLVAGSQLTVTGNSGNSGNTGAAGGTTTTTTPGVTTPTTIPADVVTNTQPEPWNPYPCTLGATQAAPASTTTTKAPAKAAGPAKADKTAKKG